MLVTYHPAAEAEVLEAIRYYEGKVPGLGGRFLEDFDEAISSIRQAPHRWPVVEGDLRRHLLRRFPFGIYYRTEVDELRILIVKHHARHPDYGEGRR